MLCTHGHKPLITPSPLRQIRGLLNLSVNCAYSLCVLGPSRAKQRTYIGNAQGLNTLYTRFTHVDTHSNTQMHACAHTQHMHSHVRYTRQHVLNALKHTPCTRLYIQNTPLHTSVHVCAHECTYAHTLCFTCTGYVHRRFSTRPGS